MSPLEDLVFDVLSRNKATHSVLLVWQQCYRQAQLEMQGLTNGDIAQSLGMSRDHVRRCLKLLGKLGLVAAKRLHANSGFDLILVLRDREDDEMVVRLLEELRSGPGKIEVERPRVEMNGVDVDLSERSRVSARPLKGAGTWFANSTIATVTKDLSNPVTKEPSNPVTKEHSNKEHSNPNIAPLELFATDVAVVGPAQAEKKQGKDTWLTPFSDRWAQKCGVPHFGKLSSALRPLVNEHGSDEVLARWGRYLDATEARFCSVHRFVETFNTWASSTQSAALLGSPDRKVRMRSL